jgi:uroporphyrin-III C-methyltransferase
MSDAPFDPTSFGRLALPRFQPGEVWLTGAGPGDPGLLTLHALNALGQADIILYDALVHDSVLRLAGPGVVLENAGKRGGRPSPSQRDITERLIELARQGRKVLRLKGGDPFVFGRGGEEAFGLAAAGISFRIIPGVTAGLGGLAYASIPATTRDTNHGVILITGQYAAGDGGSLEWDALARTGLPIIIYMGMGRLPEIADALMAKGQMGQSQMGQSQMGQSQMGQGQLGQGQMGQGLAPETAVAVVCDATTPRQRVLVTTLGHVAAEVVAHGLGSPAIIAIGEMVRLREALLPFAITLSEAP